MTTGSGGKKPAEQSLSPVGILRGICGLLFLFAVLVLLASSFDLVLHPEKKWNECLGIRWIWPQPGRIPPPSR